LPLFAITISLCVLAWSALRYVKIESKKLQLQRFENFQMLIEIVNNVDEQGGLYPQLAAAYELRNFPEYGEILQRMYERHMRALPGFERVAEEINATIAFLKK